MIVIRSLRGRLLVGIAATTLAGWVVTAAALYVSMCGTLYRQFDNLLAAKARALATLVEQRGDAIVESFQQRPMQEFARKVRPEFYQLWDEKGDVLAKSRRLADANLEALPGSLAAPQFRSTRLPDGRLGRLVGVRFLPAVDGESLDLAPTQRGEDPEGARDQVVFAGRRHVTLVVATETAELHATLCHVARILAGVSAITIAATLALLGWVVKRTLRPLDDLAQQISGLHERDLAARVRLDRAPLELAPVVGRLNELVSRLDEAFQRERTFSANVAHELRTPLAGLRTMLDVVLGRRRGASEYRRVLEDCQARWVGVLQRGC